ncbi:MAG: hypothetical protein LBP71_05375 [Spirochaetaceae bacterium]|jgi:hypothetical protein|nr:hypothetical protein [Spirochaetaceae bacterium]
MVDLKESEELLVREIEAYLDSRFPEDAELVRQRFICLKALGEAVSSFPSVRDAHTLRGVFRDEEKLIKVLCDFMPSARMLHIPTKIVATRSYLIAKAHAFSLLSILVQDTDQFYTPVRRVIFSIICTIMTEEVYLSFLADHGFSGDIKFRLANDLISLWDSGTDPRSVQHLPALEALWAARDATPPSFGTMDGASELIRISLDLEKDWRDFLVSQTANDETRWALEEFLFGLSYEEITEVRSRLRRFGVSAVNYDEIPSFLGSKPAYTEVTNADPRAIYDFYVDRRDAAAFRKRISAPGPKRTLEETYLRYRITQE